MAQARTAFDLLAHDLAQSRRVAADLALAREKRSISESSIARPSMRLIDALGDRTSTGANVTTHAAATISTVNACVGLLSDMTAKLPLKVYQKTAAGREEAVDHPSNKLISVDPGCSSTPFELRQLIQTGVGYGGQGFARVHRDPYYQPSELEWVKPIDVQPDRFRRQLVYKVKDVPGILTRADIIHVRAQSMDGINGMSPVRLMRESIGLSLTQRQQTGKIYANGAQFPGFITTPQTLQKNQVDDFRKAWDEAQAGPDNAGKTPILWGGYDYKAVNGMTMQDAQFLESRKFERSEIATFYRIPEILLGNSDKASSWGSGIETLTSGFLTFCFDPWLVNWEQALNYTLLTFDEQAAGFYFKFNRRALLAVALETQAKFLREMRDIGVYSVNDCRSYLEENDLPDHIGDNYQLPFNGSGGTPNAKPAEQTASAA